MNMKVKSLYTCIVNRCKKANVPLKRKQLLIVSSSIIEMLQEWEKQYK